MKKRIIRVVITALVCAGILIWDKHENKKMREHYEQVKYDETQTEATTVDMEFGYYKNNDGLWVYKGRTYKEKIELSGKRLATNKEIIYIVLTNKEDITFKDIETSYVSSDIKNMLDVNDVCVVDVK